MKTFLAKSIGAYLDALSIISPGYAARVGFSLFCRPIRTRVNEKQTIFFDSAHRFNFVHEGYNIQGYRWGAGPKKVLFVHGWQSHTYRWKPYVEALLNEDYTVFSLDAPGHGLSSGNFLSVPLYSSMIEAFIKQGHNLDTVIGHSLGGFSLLYTLYREPELPIQRLVLLAPPGEAADFISAFKNTLGVSDRTVKLVVEYFAKRYEVGPDFFSARKFAERVKLKGLIIHDEHDAEAPHHYSIGLARAWEPSRLISTKGLGHNLKSPSVIKEVVDFLREPVHQPSVL